ncbi:MAG: zinc dependent phospholipase C family protein [Promethearchaeota archaeon]|nr:MAG: zinc dependent phospholipase C family protein [Candidatus Lokiarchaeota archaeon]
MKVYNKRRIKYGLILLAVAYLVNMTWVDNGEAWLNGAYNAYTFNAYRIDWYQSAASRKGVCYGTHDWIAECAVELLYEFYPGNLFIQMLKLNTYDLKLWYLFGTEAPDTVWVNKFVSVNTGLHTITTANFYQKLSHQEHLPLGSLRTTRNNLEKHALLMVKNIEQMFREYDCKAAAFFLGCLAHYIADATYYHHLISGPNIATLHSIRSSVQKITNIRYSSWPTDRGGPFFQILDARTEFSSYKPKIRPDNAVFYAAYDTVNGKAESTFTLDGGMAFKGQVHKDAYWMQARTFPEDAIITTRPMTNWRYDDWNSIYLEGENEDFLKTVHHNLNIAVYYCAAAINHVVDKYTSCLFIGEKLQEHYNELTIQTAFYMLLAVAGPLATMFTVVEKLSEKVYLLIFKNLKQMKINKWI